MTDDRMLHESRRAPDPAFARGLRERLRAQEGRTPSPRLRWRPLAAVAAIAAVVMAIVTVPSVRSSAEAMLDLLRVRRFTAVPFDASRMEALRSLEKENALELFGPSELVRDPGRRRPVPTLEEAGAEGNLRVVAPTYLPGQLALDSIFVEGAGALRVQMSAPRLRDLLDRLDLRDVSIPEGIDGQWIEVRKAPVVAQLFRGGSRRAMLLQSRSPEVSMPAGVDLERLAEVGLRVLGLNDREARRVARSTDWRSTLVVPVPIDAGTFRQVTVRGRPALLITTTGEDRAGGKGRRRTVILWSEDERVLGLIADLSPQAAMQMVESLR